MRDLTAWLRGWSREAPFRISLGPSYETRQRSVTGGTVGDLRDALEGPLRVVAELNLARAGIAEIALAAGRPDLTDPRRIAAVVVGLRSHYDANRRPTAKTLETNRV